MPAQFPYFTEEHDLIRRTVRRFAKEEIAPFAAQWDEEGIFPRELFQKAAALGLFGIRMDPKYGGNGMDWWASAAYLEEMAHGDNAGVAMAMMVQSEITIPVIAELGTEDQSVRSIAIAFKESRRLWFRELLVQLGVADAEGLATQLALLVDGSIAQDLVRNDPAMARAAREAARVLLKHAGIEVGSDAAAKKPPRGGK